MNSWLRQHRILVYVNLGLLAVSVLFWMLIVSPRQAAVDGMKNDIDNVLKKLVDDGLPTDLMVLNDAKTKLDNELSKLRKNRDTLMQDCTMLLVNRVQEEAKNDTSSHFTDVAGFVTGSGELHARYRKEFKELQQKFMAWQIPLPGKKVLGVDEDSLVGDNNNCPAWQLILKLWTVEAAVEMARDSGLYIRQVTPPIVPGDSTLSISARGIRAYTLGAGTEVNPWLIEVPVRLEVKGTPMQIRDFLAKTRRKETFMPLSSFEMRLACPNPPPMTPDGRLDLVNVLATIEVCAFFPVEGTGKKTKPAAAHKPAAAATPTPAATPAPAAVAPAVPAPAAVAPVVPAPAAVAPAAPAGN
jgi:hypothetical protein